MSCGGTWIAGHSGERGEGESGCLARAQAAVWQQARTNQRNGSRPLKIASDGYACRGQGAEKSCRCRAQHMCMVWHARRCDLAVSQCSCSHHLHTSSKALEQSSLHNSSNKMRNAMRGSALTLSSGGTHLYGPHRSLVNLLHRHHMPATDNAPRMSRCNTSMSPSRPDFRQGACRHGPQSDTTDVGAPGAPVTEGWHAWVRRQDSTTLPVRAPLPIVLSAGCTAGAAQLTQRHTLQCTQPSARDRADICVMAMGISMECTASRRVPRVHKSCRPYVRIKPAPGEARLSHRTRYARHIPQLP